MFYSSQFTLFAKFTKKCVPVLLAFVLAFSPLQLVAYDFARDTEASTNYETSNNYLAGESSTENEYIVEEETVPEDEPTVEDYPTIEDKPTAEEYPTTEKDEPTTNDYPTTEEEYPTEEEGPTEEEYPTEMDKLLLLPTFDFTPFNGEIVIDENAIPLWTDHAVGTGWNLEYGELFLTDSGAIYRLVGRTGINEWHNLVQRVIVQADATIILDNFFIEGENQSLLDITDYNVVLELVGENMFFSNDSNDQHAVINTANAALTIQGNGSLYLYAPNRDTVGIGVINDPWSWADPVNTTININSGFIDIEGGEAAIGAMHLSQYYPNNFVVNINGGEINAMGWEVGIGVVEMLGSDYNKLSTAQINIFDGVVYATGRSTGIGFRYGDSMLFYHNFDNRVNITGGEVTVYTLSPWGGCIGIAARTIHITGTTNA